MKVTIEISAEAIDLVKELAMDRSEKNPTKKELEKFFAQMGKEFFAQDVFGFWDDSFGKKIDDAVDEYFG